MLRRYEKKFGLITSLVFVGCATEPNVCERALPVSRAVSQEHCVTIEGCAWCDCILSPDTPGCDVHERDARWIASCHDDAESVELAEACLDGDPMCRETIEGLIDLGCAVAP